LLLLLPIHIETQTFSAVSSVNLNSVFSSNYDDYKIVINASSATANTDLNFRVRSGTNDVTTTTYARQYLIADNTTIIALRETSQTSIILGNTTLGDQSHYTVEIGSPFLSQVTLVNSFNANRGGAITIQNRGGAHQNATSYDGFTIFAANNFTGRLSVYGYRK